MLFQRLLVGLVDYCRRHGLLVVLGGLALAGFAGVYAAHHLGISTDTDEMFARSLPWRQRALAFKAAFPQFSDLLVAVINAKEPEQAEATAAGLAAALAEDHVHFRALSRPDSSPFLNREGLLFLDTKQLAALLEQTIDAQPFPVQERRGVGTADGAKMHMVCRQGGGQPGGGSLRLRRLLGVDDRHQQIRKLGKLRLERQGPLAPGQTPGEHFIGIGVDPEVMGRVGAGEAGESEAAQDDKQPMASAIINQADEQALKYHRKPASYPALAVDAWPSPRAQPGSCGFRVICLGDRPRKGDSRFTPRPPPQNAVTGLGRPALWAAGDRASIGLNSAR